jgi:F0F1-type ATP synthase delta subunit
MASFSAGRWAAAYAAACEESQKRGGGEEALRKCAARLLYLLALQKQRSKAPAVLSALERLAEKAQGVKRLRLESAAEPDAAFLDELRKDWKVESSVQPSLINGYRLMMGGELLDYSARGQLERMREEMENGELQ